MAAIRHTFLRNNYTLLGKLCFGLSVDNRKNKGLLLPVCRYLGLTFLWQACFSRSGGSFRSRLIGREILKECHSDEYQNLSHRVISTLQVGGRRNLNSQDRYLSRPPDSFDMTILIPDHFFFHSHFCQTCLPMTEV